MSEIEKYINEFPSDLQEKLWNLYAIIKEVIPDETTEKISWQMPTFYLNGNLVHFAGFKQHLGLYPGASGIENFKSEFEKLNLKYSKGAVQFKCDQELPKELIQNIVKFKIKEQTTNKL